MRRLNVGLLGTLLALSFSCATTLREKVSASKASTVAIRLVVLAQGPHGPVQVGMLNGSGVAIDSDRVVTCVHVVHPAEWHVLRIQVIRDADWKVGVQTFRVRAHVATIEWQDAGKDLAVLSVPGLDATPAELSAEPLEAGDDAFWLGHPFGGSPNVAAGIVADVGPIDERVSGYRLDGTVSPGNSGGGLFSRESGRLVGIVNAKQGGLSEPLQAYRDRKQPASKEGGDVNTVLREAIQQMGADLQLGLGYAIQIEELPASEREKKPSPQSVFDVKSWQLPQNRTRTLYVNGRGD